MQDRELKNISKAKNNKTKMKKWMHCCPLISMLDNNVPDVYIEPFERVTYWGFLTQVSGVSAPSPLAVFAGQTLNPPWPGFCKHTHRHTHAISTVTQ